MGHSLPPPIICARGIPYSKKIISIFDCGHAIRTKKRNNPSVVFHPLHNCWPRTDQDGLHRVSVITPNLRTQQATPPSVVCKLIIVQLKLSQLTPCNPCPTRACVADVHLLRFFFPFPLMFGFQSFKLYLILEHNARLVCNTDSGATGDIEEGKTCIGPPFGVHMLIRSCRGLAGDTQLYVRRLVYYY